MLTTLTTLLNKHSHLQRITILLWLLITAGCTDSTNKQDQYYSRAKAYFEEGNYVKANVETRNVLQINPEHVEARYLMAQLAEQNKDWQQLFANTRAVIELDPNHVPALIKLSQLYLLNNAYDQALQQANNALKIEPDHLDARALKSKIHYHQDEHELAFDMAESVLSENPAHTGAIWVLTKLYQDQQPDKALDVVNDGIEHQNQNTVLKLIKIGLLEQNNQLDEAVTLYEEMIAENPNNTILSYRLIKLLEKNRRIEQAEQHLRQLIDKNPDKTPLKLWLVQFISEYHDIATAEKTLRQLAAQEPEEVEYRFALGEIHIAKQEESAAKAVFKEIVAEYEEGVEAIKARTKLLSLAVKNNDKQTAQQLIKDILELEPENSQALLTRAKISMADKDMTSGISDLRVIVKNDPRSTEALMLLGQAHQLSGHQELALDNYLQILAIQPQHLPALINSAKIQLASSGQLNDVETWLLKVLEQQPAHREALQLLTLTYAKQDQWNKSFTLTDSLIEQQDDPKLSAYGYYLKGQLHGANKAPQEAIKAFKQCIEIMPSSTSALKKLAQVYLSIDKRENLIQYLTTHVDNNPQHIAALELMGQLTAQTDPAKAATLYEDAIKRHTNHAPLYSALGLIYNRLGQPNQAKQTFERGLTINKDNPNLLLMLASHEEQHQNPHKAEKLYNQLLTIQPLSVIAANNLAMLYSNQLANSENLEKALALMEGLPNLEEPTLLDTLGWIHFKLNQHDQAISYFESALQSAKSRGASDISSLLYYHLAKTYLAKGEKNSAKQQLELAKQSEPNPSLAKKIEAEIIQL